MSYAEELWGHFYNMDTNVDKYLDSNEMVEYLNINKTEGKHGRKTNELRQLCLDALVEEGDKNFDWRLSYQEYKALLSESFTPSAKRKYSQRESLNMYDASAERILSIFWCQVTVRKVCNISSS